MANHTITVINKNSGSGKSYEGSSKNKKKKNTSALELYKLKKQKFAGLKTAGKIGIALAVATTGANAYFSIAAAATGENIKYNNYKAMLSGLLNPVGLAANMIKRATVDQLSIDRQNISLNYQRQLTGSLVYSQKFNNGTF